MRSAAKPRPIRIKDAPEVCAQAVVAWHKRYVISDDTRRQWLECKSTETGAVSLAAIYRAMHPTMTWRLPYDHRRAY